MEALEHAVRLARYGQQMPQTSPIVPVDKPVVMELPIIKEIPVYVAKSPIPAEIARESDPFFPRVFPFPRVKDIQLACCKEFGFEFLELISTRRFGPLVHARHVTMYLVKTLTPHSYPEIGRRFGDKDHTTILHACRKIARRLERDVELRSVVKKLTEIFKPEQT